MLSGVYSFLMATVLVALDAVDVAMTEASVGAGISTVLLLGALFLCKAEEAKPVRKPWLPLAVVGRRSAALLVYGTLGLPAFSDPAGADPHPRRAALPERDEAGRSACPMRSRPCSRAIAATTRWARRRSSSPPASA